MVGNNSNSAAGVNFVDSAKDANNVGGHGQGKDNLARLLMLLWLWRATYIHTLTYSLFLSPHSVVSDKDGWQTGDGDGDKDGTFTGAKRVRFGENGRRMGKSWRIHTVYDVETEPEAAGLKQR